MHDTSKFGPEERIPYIWLTEYYHYQFYGQPFTYPAGVEEQVQAAIQHHVTTNRHHPEFHADSNDMSDVDLFEMVCDWTAMAQEFGQDGGSACGWADKTIGSRHARNFLHFSRIALVTKEHKKAVALAQAGIERCPEQASGLRAHLKTVLTEAGGWRIYWRLF